MKIIEIKSPQEYTNHKNNLWLFLGGGIQNCPDWQNEVIKNLNLFKNDLSKDLIVFNPRQDSFDITNKDVGVNQIKWEFNYLNQMDVFTLFFFGPTISDQPICFYELGRYIEIIKNKFPSDWEKRIIIFTTTKFKRALDVVVQTSLATNNKLKICLDISDNSNYIDMAKVYTSKIINKIISL